MSTWKAGVIYVGGQVHEPCRSAVKCHPLVVWHCKLAMPDCSLITSFGAPDLQVDMYQPL